MRSLDTGLLEKATDPVGEPDADVTLTVQVRSDPMVTVGDGHVTRVVVGRIPPTWRGVGFPIRRFVPTSSSTGISPHTVLAAEAGGTSIPVAVLHGPPGRT